MEKNNNLRDNISELRDMSRSIYSSLKNISNEQIKCADELERVRNNLKNLYAAMSVITEASDSFSSTIRKSDELLSLALSFSNEILEKIRVFFRITDNLSQRLDRLTGKREEINSIVKKLLELNQASSNTARNAEIKSYQAGSSGRGFEVVAGELGNLTGQSLKMVDAMVESLEILGEESKKIVDNFKTLEDTLSSFEEFKEQLEFSSNDLKGKNSLIIETIDQFIELLERINTKRQNIDVVANSLLLLSRNFILKAGKINLMQGQKDSIGEIIEHHSNLHQDLRDFRSPDIIRNIPQLDSTLNVMFSLSEDSLADLENLKEGQITESLDLSELQDIQEMLTKVGEGMKKIEEIIPSTLEKARQSIDSINKIKSFIDKEIEEIKEVGKIQESLNMVSVRLGRLAEEIDGLCDRARVVSLYGKIEASRISGDLSGLDAIVGEMQSLSSDYSEIAKGLWGFFNPVREEIEKLDMMVQKLMEIINRLRDMVFECENAFKGNEEQIKYLTEIVTSIKPSIDKQKDIVAGITDSFELITAAGNRNIEVIRDIEERMAKEKKIGDNIMMGAWRDIQSFNILSKDKGKELRVYLPREPLDLDPVKIGDADSNKVASSIHRGLFNFSFRAEVYPLIVSDWELSEDALEWRFTIRDDVVAHNGEKIDAEDIKYSLERIKEGPQKFIFDPITSIRVGSPYTIMIRLKTPFMPLIPNLATTAGSIISKSYKEDTNRIPKGIGPFKFVEWEKGSHITLEAHTDYVLGPPYPSRLIYKKADSGLIAFKENLVDVTEVSSEDVPKIREDPNLLDKLIASNYLNVNYMGFNFNRTDLPFSDRRVRQALNYAVNKEVFIKETASGLGTVSRGVFPPSLSVYNPNLRGYGYNPHTARDLLKEAGYQNGLPDVYKLTIQDSPINLKRAEFLKKSFANIGVQIEIEEYPWGEFLKKAHNGETQLFLLGWGADTGDPNNFLFPLFHSSSKGASGNSTFYSNKEVDSLIEGGLREINPVKREEIYRKTERMIVEDAPFVFLVHYTSFTLVRPGVYGFKPDPLNHPHFEWMGVE